MHSTLLTLASLATVAVAFPYQIQSFAPGFTAAEKQGCISVSDIADGAPVVIHDCNTEDVSKHTWAYSLYTREDAGPQPITLFGTDKCLDVKDGSNTDGTELQIWTCVEGSTNQQWISVRDNTLRWANTDKCIDLPNGDITDGTELQIWTCAFNNENQAWSGNKVPNTESFGSNLIGGYPDVNRPNMCLVAESDTEGASVALAVCDKITETFPAGNQTWVVPTIPLSGPIKTYGGSKCLDINGDSSNGNLLKISTCDAGSDNQRWKVVTSPQLTISLAGQNKCIDITNGNLTAGNPLQVWDCDSSNNNQMWFVSQE
ncbi:ricin B-like lectin [Marasmius fiardii PR-910]|nr:ricin B-like lectin [Marasmius fiardii PR-910]